MARPLVCLCVTGKTLAEDVYIVERYKNYIDIVELRAPQIALHRRIRRHNAIVLILPPVVRPLRAQHADHLECHIPDADYLAERIFALVEKIVPDRRANRANPRGGNDIAIGEKASVRDRPVGNRQYIRRNSLDAGRPVPGGVDNLR